MRDILMTPPNKALKVSIHAVRGKKMGPDSPEHLKHLAGMENMRKELEKMEAAVSQLEQQVGSMRDENERKTIADRIATLKTIAEIGRHALAMMESEERNLEP
jgi:hypothetical protein